MKKLRVARNGYILMSIVCYVVGLACIIPPKLSPLAICILSGVLLILYGVIKIIGYFSSDLYCLAFQYDLACGLFLIALGIIILACNKRLLPYLSFGLGVLVLLDSLLSIQTAKDAKKFGLTTWYIILTVSVISGIFSVLLITTPFKSQFASQIVAGGTLLAEGLRSHCLVHHTVKTMKNHTEKSSEL